MSPFTICTYLRNDSAGRPINVLSIFLHPVQFNEALLDEAIAPTLTRSEPFDRIHIHGVPDSVNLAREIFKQESAVLARLSKTLAEIDTQLIFVTWSQHSNNNFSAEMLNGETSSDDEAILLEQRFSLFEAFIKNGDLVTAVRGTHFTKPSGTHSLQFLRAANVLEESAISHQLSFWLYPLLRTRNINRLIVDTSGITPVAYALAYERLHRGAANYLPMIESHASYGGLDTLTVPDPENTVFLISASTSGSLANKLIEKGGKPQNIYTLFFLGSTTPGTVLCNLSEDKKSRFVGIPKISNYTSDDCPECNKHSYAIPIVGDQFRTEPAKVEEITIALADFDETSRAVLDRVISTGLFKVFRYAGNRNYELYLDIESMLSGNCTDESARERVREIQSRLNRLIRRGMPVHLTRIVPTAYPGAATIAELAHSILPSQLQQISKIVQSNQILPAPPVQESATLVVSACMDDTYELMGISRDLRKAQPGGSITYVSPISRACNDQERRRIESNLTFGDQGPKTFSLLSVFSIDLPLCNIDHSWKLEHQRLTEIQYWCDMQGEETPELLKNRIELLRLAPGIGLLDDLFWPEPSGNAMTLASDFTMIPTQDGQRQISQADVFAIVTTLFHKYRDGTANKPKLVQKTYERAVISPESFQRFSDGVLQAAFLRAARPGEIAYGNCDESASERMLKFLQGEAESGKHGGGPALMEYLVSLLIGRLTLHPMHTSAFLRNVIDSGLAPHFTLTARFLSHEMEI